jgi:hypothetical protein
MNAGMPIARLTHSQVRHRTRSGIASAPLTFVLAALSIAITLTVAIGAVAHGRVPPSGQLGLICAVVLAAAAAAEATRPARSDRARRRLLGRHATTSRLGLPRRKYGGKNSAITAFDQSLRAHPAPQAREVLAVQQLGPRVPLVAQAEL